MSLLLDTHVALWAITGDPTLGQDFLERLRYDPDIFLSPVSLWEITIKQATGKLGGPADRRISPSEYGTWASANCRSPMFTRSRPVGCHRITVIPSIACWWPKRSLRA